MTMLGLKRKAGPPAADLPSHVKGVKEGNSKGNYERQKGWTPDGRETAEASTGINAERRNPIDPRMPNLPPA
jgi:hypothetical protein